MLHNLLLVIHVESKKINWVGVEISINAKNGNTANLLLWLEKKIEINDDSGWHLLWVAMLPDINFNSALIQFFIDHMECQTFWLFLECKYPV